MTTYNYSFKGLKENMARAIGRDLDLSTKKAIEICSFIRNKSLENAKTVLEETITQKNPIPFKRFTEGAGHKPGMGSAKYPVNAAKQILKTLNAAESNAKNKGLSKNLKIIHLSAQKASTPWHYGRKRRIKMKRTHIEVIVGEYKEKKPKMPQKEENKKENKEIPKKPLKGEEQKKPGG